MARAGPDGDLHEFYRTLTTERLQRQVADYDRLAARARRLPGRSVWSAEYYEARAAAMRAVLGERGVEVSASTEPDVVKQRLEGLRERVRTRAEGER